MAEAEIAVRIPPHVKLMRFIPACEPVAAVMRWAIGRGLFDITIDGERVTPYAGIGGPRDGW